jgi:hemin uptake protein HemP
MSPTRRPTPTVPASGTASGDGARTPNPPSVPPPRLDSDALFGRSDVVLIQHAGETYRLQRTRLGKLILTK